MLAETEQLITILKHALADKNKIAQENVQRVRQAEILLEDRDTAKELEEKAVAVLEQERKTYDKLVKKLKAEKQSSEQEALCMRAFMAEARRQKEVRKAKRQTASSHCSAPQTACRNAEPQAADTLPRTASQPTSGNPGRTSESARSG